MKFKYKCDECFYYCKRNNTCLWKKCRTGGYGYITPLDRLFCIIDREENESIEEIFREYERRDMNKRRK